MYWLRSCATVSRVRPLVEINKRKSNIKSILISLSPFWIALFSLHNNFQLNIRLIKLPVHYCWLNTFPSQQPAESVYRMKHLWIGRHAGSLLERWLRRAYREDVSRKCNYFHWRLLITPHRSSRIASCKY